LLASSFYLRDCAIIVRKGAEKPEGRGGHKVKSALVRCKVPSALPDTMVPRALLVLQALLVLLDIMVQRALLGLVDCHCVLT